MATMRSLIYRGEEKENRGDVILGHYSVQGVLNRRLLEFATGYSASCCYEWQEKLTARQFLKRWPRPNARTQYVHTLTERGEGYLEDLGYPRKGYADIYSSKKINAYHHLGVSRASLCFLACARDLEWKAEVLPQFTFAYDGDNGLKMDKMWKADDDSYAVEWENSKKPDDVILRKMNGYVRAVNSEIFGKRGFKRLHVLWITPSPGKLPRLQELAMKSELYGLFSFTHESKYLRDYVRMGTEPIWWSANGKELML